MIVQEAMEAEGFKLSVLGKSKIVEILNSNIKALKEFLIYFAERICEYNKSDNALSPMYNIIWQIFHHFLLTESVIEENLKILLFEVISFLTENAMNGSSKYQYRSLKLMWLIFNCIGSKNIMEFSEENQQVLDEGEKIWFLNLKSNNDKIWNITFEFWKTLICKHVQTKPWGHMLEFSEIFFSQSFNNSKSGIREKSIKALQLTSQKAKKIYQLWFDKSPNVRSAVYWKLNWRNEIFEIPPSKLYLFLNQGFNEKDDKVRKDFIDLLVSFLVHPEKPQKRRSSEIKEESKEEPKDNIKEYTFSFDYKYEGSRKRQVAMSFFEMFSKLKIHKTHYIDGFSVLPQKFLAFIFNTFEKSDIIKWMEDTFQSILNVIVRKSNQESITFAHFSFLRYTMEYLKFFLNLEMEGSDWIENLIPEIDDYATIFNFFSTKRLWRREELEILSEWCKYSINMSYNIPSIKEKLRELFINFISEPDHSITHYTYLVEKALKNEREYEKEIDDADILSVEHRDFKNIYLKKRSISNIWKPITWNAYVSDPDDVWVVMIIVLFQISQNDVNEFIAAIKEAVRIVRDQVDAEEDEIIEDQLEQSIPQK